VNLFHGEKQRSFSERLFRGPFYEKVRGSKLPPKVFPQGESPKFKKNPGVSPQNPRRRVVNKQRSQGVLKEPMVKRVSRVV